jgi:hypothetical protein
MDSSEEENATALEDKASRIVLQQYRQHKK